jgi:ribose 5-phosphate isomerase B
MKIAIGSDHAGFDLKQKIAQYLDNQSIAIEDCGTYSLASCDYPDYAHAVATAVENEIADFGLLVCGSGQGVAITANKHQNIRAALCWTAEIAALSREHNNANVLCLPARFVTENAALAIVDSFLKTTFAGGRHQTRVEKITNLKP